MANTPLSEQTKTGPGCSNSMLIRSPHATSPTLRRSTTSPFIRTADFLQRLVLTVSCEFFQSTIWPRYANRGCTRPRSRPSLSAPTANCSLPRHAICRSRCGVPTIGNGSGREFLRPLLCSPWRSVPTVEALRRLLPADLFKSGTC